MNPLGMELVKLGSLDFSNGIVICWDSRMLKPMAGYSEMHGFFHQELGFQGHFSKAKILEMVGFRFFKAFTERKMGTQVVRKKQS